LPALFVTFSRAVHRLVVLTAECLPVGIQPHNELVKKFRKTVRVRFFGDALAEL